MKIRILSDLHRQINKYYPLTLENNYDFTLIAGDIGPDFKENAQWIKENVHVGALISGNHDAYTLNNTPLDDVKKFYHETFPLDGGVTYFDYDVGVMSKEIGNNLLLVADVLYTDYSFKCYPNDSKLTKKELVECNIRRAEPKFSGSYMNDFFFFTRDKRFTKRAQDKHFKDLPEDIHYLNPRHYIDHFKKSFKEITRIIEENPDKEIILMTHHCLSPKCMGPYMDKQELSASYVTDKTAWIKKHTNIKLIVSGHIHNRAEFKIGNTLYVMNPLGYCKENQDTNWTPDFFVDTDTWTTHMTPYKNEDWEKSHKKDMVFASILF